MFKAFIDLEHGLFNVMIIQQSTKIKGLDEHDLAVDATVDVVFADEQWFASQHHALANLFLELFDLCGSGFAAVKGNQLLPVGHPFAIKLGGVIAPGQEGEEVDVVVVGTFASGPEVKDDVSTDVGLFIQLDRVRALGKRDGFPANKLLQAGNPVNLLLHQSLGEVDASLLDGLVVFLLALVIRVVAEGIGVKERELSVGDDLGRVEGSVDGHFVVVAVAGVAVEIAVAVASVGVEGDGRFERMEGSSNAADAVAVLVFAANTHVLVVANEEHGLLGVRLIHDRGMGDDVDV